MNFNDDPERLKQEEQEALNNLIFRMNQVLNELDKQMRNYVREAQNADISINPDLYLAKLLAQKGKKDTVENRKKFLQARDEMYHTRLLLKYEDSDESGIDEVKVGLHSCTYQDKTLVTSWTMPLCRHYILDNASTKYENVVKNKRGEEFKTKYTLLVKNQVTLRFTRVAKALNLFPGIFDDKTLKMIKGTGFISDAYLDEMIKNFDPDEYNPDAAAQIISDEFLQELLERRSTPEFKNIVFSIQRKQGEIIQAPYNNNMIVQGCAGSGKSMIMLHRLPILLYDNPDRLKRTNLYIITPSQMYIQLAENMRYQLKISDINMGTIEQYYDYCISKYPGHNPTEYGKINYGWKVSSEIERYIYSKECIEDINKNYAQLEKETDSLEKAYLILNVKENVNQLTNTYAQRINLRLLKLQNILNANREIIFTYFNGIRFVLETLNTLSATLCKRRSNVLHEINKQISKKRKEIENDQKELEKLDSEENEIAVSNRNSRITAAQNCIEYLKLDLVRVEADNVYFDTLLKVNEKIDLVLEPFSMLKNEFSKNEYKDIYDAIDKIGQLIGGFYMLSWEFSKIEDKYETYLGAIAKDVEKVGQCVRILQNTTEKYLDYEYFCKIKEERDVLEEANRNAIENAYKNVMKNIGAEFDEEEKLKKAIRFSPYIYLQAIYCYQGAPISRETLLAIDEGQGIAPEELRLLKEVNGDSAIFNMFGDVYQHIEGTKGIDSWEEYKNIFEFDLYEMQENYRNASQITEYCNRVFDMSMIAINTPGKGVHELQTEKEFYEEMISQLLDDQRTGLAAILISNNEELKYLLSKFANYKQKFHDMTGEDFNIHRTRWNIINIDDAKGLEFSSVIVLSGRMSRNEKYIAFTRALDDLYVYAKIIGGVDDEEDKIEIQKSKMKDRKNGVELSQKHSKSEVKKAYAGSSVRQFFESKGVEVKDDREQGGRLWVIGEKSEIRNVVNEAIAKFGISGKYMSSDVTKNRRSWCTKTDK